MIPHNTMRYHYHQFLTPAIPGDGYEYIIFFVFCHLPLLVQVILGIDVKTFLRFSFFKLKALHVIILCKFFLIFQQAKISNPSILQHLRNSQIKTNTKIMQNRICLNLDNRITLTKSNNSLTLLWTIRYSHFTRELFTRFE